MIVVMMGMTPVFTSCDEIVVEDNPVPAPPAPTPPTPTPPEPTPPTPTPPEPTPPTPTPPEPTPPEPTPPTPTPPSPQPEIKVEGIAITGFTSDGGNTASTTVVVGTSLNLGVTIEPAEMKDVEVVWKSGNESIVTVSSNGVVTAVAPGEAVVTVSYAVDPNISATLTIEVVGKVDINSEPIDQSAAETRG